MAVAVVGSEIFALQNIEYNMASTPFPLPSILHLYAKIIYKIF